MARTPRNREEAFHNARAAVNKIPFFSGSMRQSLLMLLDYFEDVLDALEEKDSPEPASVPAEPPSPSGGSSSKKTAAHKTVTPTKPATPEPPSLSDVVGKDDDI